METQTTRAIPLWGWPLLLIFLGGSGIILSFIGSDFVIPYAHWADSLWWGIGAGLSLAFSLWACRVRSPDLATATAICFFVFILINAQIQYYHSSKSVLFKVIQQDEEDEWPAQWKQLDRNELYSTFTEQRIGRSGFDWLDHLRVEADIGVIRVEKQGHRRYGGRKGVEVYRQGLWMWWGWFCCYLFLAIGCFFGMTGSSFIDKEEPREKKVADIIVKRMTETLKEKGLTDEDIHKITYRQRNYYAETKPEEIYEMLPFEDREISRDIVEDLVLAKQWYRSSKVVHTVSEEKRQRLEFLLNKFYRLKIKPGDKLYSNYLVLLAADTLFRNTQDKEFYECLLQITDIAQVLNIPHVVSPFASIDLDGIDYRRVNVGELWSPLYKGKQAFHSYDSNWELLENNRPEDIPEDAYLAIIYQYCHQPAPRGYEMWQGTTPSEFVEILAPRLRDAILTYLALAQRGSIDHHVSTLKQLVSWAAYWPTEQAEEIFMRCIKSGWLHSLDKIPDTPCWRDFIHNNDKTPFGDISTKIGRS